jgi:hypothetical protein
MTPLNSPYLHVLYCDDVRLEVGNKLTVVGIYAGQLNTPHAPAMLPKLCIVCTFAVPKQQKIKELKFRVFRDDQLQLEHLNVEFPAPPHIADDPSATRREHHAAFTFAPFPIEGPSILRVEAVTDIGIFPGPRLRIAVDSLETDKPAPIED